MRIAIFSDTHGNCLALDTVLKDIKNQSVDQMVCLGDAIQGGAQPAELTARLRDLKIPTVLGNSDAWLLSGVETDAHLISAERRKKLDIVREWSLSQLNKKDLAFINSFPTTLIVPLGKNRRLLCFHGSPTSFDQILLPTTTEDEFQNILSPYSKYILCGGHTHLQFMRRVRGSQNFFFNPGSVGIALNHEQLTEKKLLDPWAEYALLTVEVKQLSLEFKRVALDMKKMKSIYLKSDKSFSAEAMQDYIKY